MPTDVMPPAETVAATETAPEVTDYSSVLQSMTEKERQEWALTGEEPERLKSAPAAKKPAEEKKTPEPQKAKTEPEAGAGDEDDEPEYLGTPEQIKSQRKAYARLRNEKATLKVELKLLREQQAVRKPAEPAAAPKAEVKVEPIVERPKRPRMTDAKYAVTGGGELYDADMDAYDEKMDVFNRQKFVAERQKDLEQTSRIEAGKQWAADIAESEKQHADFKDVAFSASVPASYPMIGVLMGMKGGAECFYYFGSHPEESAELAKETDFPGYPSYEALTAAAAKDPALARQVGIAEGLVRAEAKRILSGTLKQKAETKPITTTKAPPPGARVAAHSATGGDPIEDAYARGDYALGAKLEAAQDVERYKSR